MSKKQYDKAAVETAIKRTTAWRKPKSFNKKILGHQINFII